MLHGQDLGLAEVEVHAMVDDGDCLEVKVAHPTDFQLVGKCRLQVTVNTILLKLNTFTDATSLDEYYFLCRMLYKCNKYTVYSWTY